MFLKKKKKQYNIPFIDNDYDQKPFIYIYI